MRMIDGLLAELEQEAETTQRVLERIPQAHLAWRPAPDVDVARCFSVNTRRP